MKVYIFDMDGTFIDSMDYWNNLMTNYLATKDIKAYDGLQLEIVSMTLKAGIDYVKEKFSIPLTSEQLLEEMVDLMAYQYKNKFNLDPSTKEIFDIIKARGDKIVLATATQRSLVDVVLNRFDLKKYFDLEFVSDEVPYHKDNVDYFKDIAKYFSVKPEDCVVVEDSLYSIKTASSLGMNLVGILFQAQEAHRDQIKSLVDVYGENLGQVKDYFII